MVVGMYNRFFGAKEIPLNPPLPKGDSLWARDLPLFEKEGLGEIYDTSHQQTMP
jgi:hypothetical protein